MTLRNNPPLKLGVSGCLGRVGRSLIAYIPANTEHTLIGGTVRESQTHQAMEVFSQAQLSSPVLSGDISIIFSQVDAVIDFTRPEYSLAVAKAASEQGKVHICGTTGLSGAQEEEFAQYAQKARIVLAPNMSVGVNVLLALCEEVAGALDASYDAEIYEIHHRHKVDAPSGTALALGQAVAKGRQVILEEVADYARHGLTGERMPGRIGFSVARAGEIIGDHTVSFSGAGERIELTHRAASRQIYAQGAVRAAEWAIHQPPGLYDMRDVLGLRTRSS